MKIEALRKVRRMFNSPDVPRQHNRSYQRQWVRQVRILGDRWLVMKKVERKGANNAAA